MMKRFALFRGKKGQLVGHPGQSLAGASYICQRQLPMPEGGLRGFGQPGYSGPELQDLYEPTIELVELTQINARTLERAVKAGHLDRSEIAHFPDRKAAEAARAQLEQSLVKRAEQAARTRAEQRAKLAAAVAPVEGVDKHLEAERALLKQLEAFDDAPPASPVPLADTPTPTIEEA